MWGKLWIRFRGFLNFFFLISYCVFGLESGHWGLQQLFQAQNRNMPKHVYKLFRKMEPFLEGFEMEGPRELLQLLVLQRLSLIPSPSRFPEEKAMYYLILQRKHGVYLLHMKHFSQVSLLQLILAISFVLVFMM